MAFKTFPKLKGPPAFVQALLLLGLLLGTLVLWPYDTAFLGANLFAVSGLLAVVIISRPFVPRFEQNLILVGILFITLAIYGLFRGFDKAEVWYFHIFEFFPALLYYFALKLLQHHFGRKKALEYGMTLVPNERLDYADTIREEYRKKPGALQAAADIYKAIAEEGLLRAPAVHPIHIKAMQRYGEMLLFDEARGKSGEGEYYSKKADELSEKLLKYSDPPPTVH